MTTSHLTLLDLLIGLAVVVTVLCALRRGRGLLAGLASGALVVLACWLALAAVQAAGPASWRHAVAGSQFARTTHPPTTAVAEVLGRVGHPVGPSHDDGPVRP